MVFGFFLRHRLACAQDYSIRTGGRKEVTQPKAAIENGENNLICYIVCLNDFRDMGMFRSIMIKLGLADLSAERTSISVMLLDDDERRHRWFKKRFDGDELFIAANVSEAKKLLTDASYDAIFLDHDLLPHHYESNDHDDFHSTGYAIAEFLHDHPDLQRAATIIVHTRNADAAVRMVQKLRDSGRSVEYCAFPYLDLKIKNYWQR